MAAPFLPVLVISPGVRRRKRDMTRLETRESVRRLGPLTTVLVAVLLLGACGDSSSTLPADETTTTTEAASEASTSTTAADDADGAGDEGVAGDAIKIAAFAYTPKVLLVEPGSTITVTNEDEAVHTVTAKDKSLDTGNLAKGQSATLTAPDSGEIPYICTIHEYMNGVIRVSG
jgi:plastocyanin